MQRINLWPNPKFDPTGFHVVKKGGDISKYMAGGTLANTRGEYIDLPFACEVGVEYVCTCRIVSNDTTNKSIGIFPATRSNTQVPRRSGNIRSASPRPPMTRAWPSPPVWPSAN